MSPTGKEILIKDVLQAIPTYTMNVFKLPKNLCKELNDMLSKFWWGNQKGYRKVQWQNWVKMSQQKIRGGMSLRDIESFNAALLAKK